MAGRSLVITAKSWRGWLISRISLFGFRGCNASANVRRMSDVESRRGNQWKHQIAWLLRGANLRQIWKASSRKSKRFATGWRTRPLPPCSMAEFSLAEGWRQLDLFAGTLGLVQDFFH